MFLKQIANNILLILFSLSALTCPLSLDCTCTDEFVTIRVVEVDENNSPITELITTVKDGLYTVMTDGYVNSFSTFPKKIIFTGKSDNLEVNANFFNKYG